MKLFLSLIIAMGVSTTVFAKMNVSKKPGPPDTEIEYDLTEGKIAAVMADLAELSDEISDEELEKVLNEGKIEAVEAQFLKSLKNKK